MQGTERVLASDPQEEEGCRVQFSRPWLMVPVSPS